jgi:hypothetical protein
MLDLGRALLGQNNLGYDQQTLRFVLRGLFPDTRTSRRRRMRDERQYPTLPEGQEVYRRGGATGLGYVEKAALIRRDCQLKWNSRFPRSEQLRGRVSDTRKSVRAHGQAYGCVGPVRQYSNQPSIRIHRDSQLIVWGPNQVDKCLARQRVLKRDRRRKFERLHRARTSSDSDYESTDGDKFLQWHTHRLK